MKFIIALFALFTISTNSFAVTVSDSEEDPEDSISIPTNGEYLSFEDGEHAWAFSAKKFSLIDADGTILEFKKGPRHLDKEEFNTSKFWLVWNDEVITDYTVHGKHHKPVTHYQRWNATGVAVTEFDDQADVPAVPLPAAGWLFAAGVFGLVSVGRRRNVG